MSSWFLLFLCVHACLPLICHCFLWMPLSSLSVGNFFEFFHKWHCIAEELIFFFLSPGDFQSCSCFSPSSNQIDAVCLKDGFQMSVIFSFINILCSFIIYGNNSLWWFCYSLLMISLGLHSLQIEMLASFFLFVRSSPPLLHNDSCWLNKFWTTYRYLVDILDFKYTMSIIFANVCSFNLIWYLKLMVKWNLVSFL